MVAAVITAILTDELPKLDSSKYLNDIDSWTRGKAANAPGKRTQVEGLNLVQGTQKKTPKPTKQIVIISSVSQMALKEKCFAISVQNMQTKLCAVSLLRLMPKSRQMRLGWLMMPLSILPSKVVVVDAATFNTAKSNVPYFSLNTSCKSHQDEEVTHDVNDWLRLINRELFEHSDQTKCSVALSRALGTAKSLID